MKTLQASQGRALGLKLELKPKLEEWYAAVGHIDRISEVIRLLFEEKLAELKNKTQLHNSMNFEIEGNKVGRLVSIFRHLKAAQYLRGPFANSYIEFSQFQMAGIFLEWLHYPTKPPYPQVGGIYDPNVLIIDTLSSLPPEAVLNEERNIDAN